MMAHQAFVGAGGKTTALFRLARELLSGEPALQSARTVLVTTTTHLGSWQASMADHVVWVKSDADLSRLEDNVPAGIVLLVGEQSDERLSSLSSDTLDRVHSWAENNHLPMLIEADGAQNKPLKAPDRHEPAIPSFTQVVIVVAGLAGLGKPLTQQWVHRPEIFARLACLQLGDPITLEAMARVLCSEAGGLKKTPSNGSKVVLLNQADTVELQEYGAKLAQILVPTYDTAIVASLSRGDETGGEIAESQFGRHGEIHLRIEPIAGIVLAAGGSSRFGQPKQLLPWQGQPFIRHVVLTALKAGLAPVEVVVGAAAPEITAAVNDMPLRIVNNIEWSQGLSTSIKAGLDALPGNVGGAIFLQADQPQTSSRLISRLIEAHRQEAASIIAPRVNGQRGNPVLFDADVFPALHSLEGDQGGRALFDKYPLSWVEWHEAEILMDIDTPDDYHHFLELHPGGDMTS